MEYASRKKKHAADFTCTYVVRTQVLYGVLQARLRLIRDGGRQYPACFMRCCGCERVHLDQPTSFFVLEQQRYTFSGRKLA